MITMIFRSFGIPSLSKIRPFFSFWRQRRKVNKVFRFCFILDLCPVNETVQKFPETESTGRLFTWDNGNFGSEVN